MTDDKPEVEEVVASEFPENKGSGNSTRYGWSVEAKSMSDPVMVGKQIFDGKWRRVSFEACEFGVPGPLYDGGHGYLGYAQSQSLRWWLHAAAEALRGFSSIDTRLVKHQIQESYTISAISSHLPIGPEDRSDILPDWNSK